MACAVLTGYIGKTRKTMSSSLDELLYKDVLDQWEYFRKTSQEVRSDTSAQRLRAFFCVETMYWSLCRNVLEKVSLQEEADRLKGLKIERSWRGLTDLIEVLRKINEEVQLVQTELTLITGARPIGKRSVSLLRKDHLTKVAAVVAMTEVAATSLRSQLRDPPESLEKVGKLFAETMTLAKVPPQKRVAYAYDLLNIREDNPLRPWDCST